MCVRSERKREETRGQRREKQKEGGMGEGGRGGRRAVRNVNGEGICASVYSPRGGLGRSSYGEALSSDAAVSCLLIYTHTQTKINCTSKTKSTRSWLKLKTIFCEYDELPQLHFQFIFGKISCLQAGTEPKVLFVLFDE